MLGYCLMMGVLDGGFGNLCVELIVVGDELLYGDIVNGNVVWFG